MAVATHVRQGLRRDLHKRVKTETEHGIGWHTVPDGHEIYDVELKMDFDRIFRVLGEQAAHNRTGRSVAMSGAVVAKVIYRRKIADKI